MKKKKCIVLFIILLCAILSSPVFAHYASITMENYNPMPGEETTIFIGWGHKFPGDGAMRREAYDNTKLEIIDPDGIKSAIDVIPEEEKGNKPIKIKFSKAGIHTVVLTQKNFSTKTTKGYKYLPKNKLENVIHSRWSETVSKAFVNVSNDQKELTEKDIKDRFQIIPMINPSQVDKGEMLPVKVTLDGKPWRGMVFATYSGFSDMADTFAYTTKTDKDGIAKIQLVEKGVWLVKADHSYPYENQDEADEYAFKATMTFKN
ncbi:conserved exported hypothetical protein [Desulfamplus magnetovallimortis]|uniref:ABC-type Co2+ transport system, periplasmic component n=1 Tax=Desulfamplus magnetovallimortis TaxID=1246637 RepID=A0A1W1HB70_9BACT|nr:DUF4198 domain-containing protein [Desulfamplus magnetovallimortis]SLM29689.1 conserved exported hypothetical protein [Desulfamplus magnetovallimortis]